MSREDVKEIWAFLLVIVLPFALGCKFLLPLCPLIKHQLHLLVFGY